MKGEKFQKLHLGNISQCWDILTLSLTINGIDFFFLRHFWCPYKSTKVRQSQENKYSKKLPENLVTIWAQWDTKSFFH